MKSTATAPSAPTRVASTANAREDAASDHAALLVRDVPETAPSGGIQTRKLFDRGHARLVLFAMDAGEELTEHSSPCRAFLVVRQGRGEVVADERTHVLEPGDVLHLPPGMPHSVFAHEAFVFLLTLVREDSTPAPKR